MRLFIAGLLLALPISAQAAQIDALDVQRQGERYVVTMDVRLDAAAPRAYAAFADPALLPAINPAVQVARVVSGAAPAFDLYTEVAVCAAFFCRTLRETQTMRLSPADDGGHIVADVLPGNGDLRYGHAEWVFKGDAVATRLHFTMSIEPAFWVPPLIGPWLISQSLRAEAQRTSAGIERVTRLQ